MLSPEAKASTRKVITTLQRMINTPDARERLGIDVQNGEVIALFPVEELAKSLSRLVEEPTVS